jgi:soluble lytic murein transglycosylase
LRKTGKRRIRNSFFIITILILLGILIINNITVQKINYPVKYKEQVIKFSLESKTDPFLIFALMKAESGFNANATSSKDAKGLMQLMDATAIEIASQIGLENFSEQDLYNPDINIRIGCWHINKLMSEFGKENTDLIIAAYNGGSRNVKNWLKDSKYSSDGKNLDSIPFKETKSFLKKVKSYYLKYKKLYENEI